MTDNPAGGTRRIVLDVPDEYARAILNALYIQVDSHVQYYTLAAKCSAPTGIARNVTQRDVWVSAAKQLQDQMK
jgi:hypothetical protein